MSKSIRPDDLAVLRFLDEQADEFRRALGLHQRGEILTWYEGPDGERAYEVSTNGFGQFELVAYEGRNPNDRLEHHRAIYEDENTERRVARRLDEHSASWEDRDIPVPGEDD